MRHGLGGGRAHAVVEVELEEGHHELGDLLGVGGKALLELLGVADEHGAGGRLLLEAGRLDAEALLVADGDELPVLLVGDLLDLVLVDDGDLGLERGRLQHRSHHHRQVLLEVLAQYLAHARPRADHVRYLQCIKGIKETHLIISYFWFLRLN